MKRAALFGGSFDPPHIGHIEIVNKLKDLEFIDKVIVMPTYLNPFKERFTAPAEIRLEWLQKLFKNDPKVHVSDFEVKRQRKVPTLETVLELKKEFDEVYVTIGSDNLKTLPKWHSFDKLKNEAKFIVATRKGYAIPKGEFLLLEIDRQISSSELREKIDTNYLPKEIAEEIYKHYKETDATTSR